MTLKKTEKKRTAIYAGFKPAQMAVLQFNQSFFERKGKEKNFNDILDHFFNKNYIYTKTNTKASTSAKTSANAKTSVKGGGKTNQRTFSFFCTSVFIINTYSPG